MKSYVVADLAGEATPEFLDRISRLVGLAVDFIQFRNKDASDEVRLQNALQVRGLVSGPTRFLVNSDIAAAVSSRADGIHLPSDRRDLPGLRRAFPRFVIGQSCHTVEECFEAAERGADYVLFGPVFAPRSKQGKSGVTREELMRAAASGVEVYALGGVSFDNLDGLRGTGIAGVAAVTLFMADEPVDRIVESVRRL